MRRIVNNEYKRQEWIKYTLSTFSSGKKILDAGCGNQQYRPYCCHLTYYAQDLGEFSIDRKPSLAGFKTDYEYGPLDYTGNIWKIAESDGFFDIILCSEVFEHIPYPEKTIKEFSRLLAPGGSLVLTVPSNCLRHMDPFFYFSGFSDRYLNLLLRQYGFENIQIKPVGSYHEWLMVETFRSMRTGGGFAWFCLFPGFVYHYMKQRYPDVTAINTLCSGYHVTAKKVTSTI
ncbi:MAG: class I SAM-dependent methyltransferase [Desulfotignum sp.]|nr:class I SAM-dependent methyltransferase [Desulfotignum sp.]MCF8138069.1 class I SAM-dependent methyltransferase [Desulfotignum sp.]